MTDPASLLPYSRMAGSQKSILTFPEDIYVLATTAVETLDRTNSLLLLFVIPTLHLHNG